MTENKIIELVVCEKGTKHNLAQKLGKHIHKTFEVLLENIAISVSVFIYIREMSCRPFLCGYTYLCSLFEGHSTVTKEHNHGLLKQEQVSCLLKT